MRIRIAGTEFSIKNKSFEIYVQGCYRGCFGCHNPETQPFEGGKSVDIHDFLKEQYDRTSLFTDLVQNVYVSGGDLLCQNGSVAEEFSRELCNFWVDKYKWLFTGADPDKIPDWVWDYYDIVKAGTYMAGLKQEGFPASANQVLIFSSTPNVFTAGEMLDKFNSIDFKGEKRWSNVRTEIQKSRIWSETP